MLQADMVLAIAVTTLVHLALKPHTGLDGFAPRGVPLRLRHYSVLLLAPLVYYVMRLCGVMH